MSQNFEENTLRLNALVSHDPPAKALAKIYRSIQRNDRSASAWVRYSVVAVGFGQRDVAERGLEFALASRRVTSSVLFDIGHIYEQIDRLESAEKCFKRVAELNPRAINPRIRQTLLLERCHQFGRARDVLDECMHLDSNDYQVQYLMALLDSREGKLDSAETRLRQILSSGSKHEYVQYASRYLLADVLDRTGRFDEAMRHLSEAKQLVAQLADTNALAQQYNSQADECAFQAKRYPRNILQIWDKYYPKDFLAPIPPFTFLGGHPRSGTTLLEQILGAHPDVAGFDEPVVLPHVLNAAHSLARQFFSNFPVNFMRRLYIKMLQNHSHQNVANKHLLEKNPSPTVMLPLLLRIFPDLRIVMALRDPRDVVLSCYFQNLDLNQTNSNFLSFKNIIHHYRGIMDVWLAVRQWNGVAWLETKYEDIVINLEKEGKKVTNFMGLQWHERQAKYFELSKQTLLRSPTYHDVGKPIYSKSMGRWRNYEKYLAPVLSELQPYCEVFGYK
jgi:tetratricopeptide (TPR) repeat protein